jgi:hypothetical protein
VLPPNLKPREPLRPESNPRSAVGEGLLALAVGTGLQVLIAMV